MKENGTENTMSNYNKIAQRAYQLWEKNGRASGKDTENWLQAEAEIRREESQRGARPAQPAARAANSGGGRRVFAL
jgi:hypothetical protein